MSLINFFSACTALCLLSLVPAAAAVEEVRLSALDLSHVLQAQEKPRADRAVTGKPLSIAGQQFDHGVGTHAPSVVHINLHGNCTRFTAHVGVQDNANEKNHTGSVEFSMEGDHKTLWSSSLMRHGMQAQRVDIDLSGIQHIVLRVSDGFDSPNNDAANWAAATFTVNGEKPNTISAPPTPARWTLHEQTSTAWSLSADSRLPHADFIEQGGLRVGQVVNYRIDAQRHLLLKRSVVWPSLRKRPNDTFGTIIHSYDASEAEPLITLDGKPLGAMTADRVLLDGTLTITGRAQQLHVTRCAFPSTTKPTAVDLWTLRNDGDKACTIAVSPLLLHQQIQGPYGVNILEVTSTAPATSQIAPGASLTFAVLFHGRLANEASAAFDVRAEETARRTYVAGINRDLRLETPDPVLNQAFAFCKLRVAESINATRGGMMLARGLAYYAAAWCNDNVEYAGPFFPFLGDQHGNQASLETYRLFIPFMSNAYSVLPYSVVAEGVDITPNFDRGDAAMYAYGCARFCLARGDKAIAEELWPAIQWCLEYCRRQTTADGVIASKSDELEGRLPTGTANLSTSSLCYGGLRSAADLARALGFNDDARRYDEQAIALSKSINNYFGATVEGFPTYRYYEGNDVLRSWICLPLCMGLMERRDGTIAALFSPRLWTADGLASQAGDAAFWDRSTLYGLRGVFQAGETTTGLSYLTAYSHRRLLGDHVPYPVEAWPEGDQRHLSSESALYCRIYSEGIFGMQPTGLKQFRCTPRLPDNWPRMALRSVRAFGSHFDLIIERQGQQQKILVQQEQNIIFTQVINMGDSALITLP